MIQVKANKESELFKTTQDIGYELETTIYTSEDKLNITIDNDKIIMNTGHYIDFETISFKII